MALPLGAGVAGAGAAGAAGAAGSFGVGEMVASLTAAGVAPQVIRQVVQSVGPSMAAQGVAATTVAPTAGLTRALVWGPAAQELAQQSPAIAQALSGGGSYGPDTSAFSKYFIDPRIYKDLQDRERRQQQWAAFDQLFGRGAPIQRADESLATLEALKQREASAYNERELARIQLEGQINRALRELELAKGLQQQGIVTSGDIIRQETASLGDIQRQRVQSSYDTAKQLLNTAIQNMTVPQDLAGSPVMQQMATMVP